jgi:hypothetical protein
MQSHFSSLYTPLSTHKGLQIQQQQLLQLLLALCKGGFLLQANSIPGTSAQPEEQGLPPGLQIPMVLQAVVAY